MFNMLYLRRRENFMSLQEDMAAAQSFVPEKNIHMDSKHEKITHSDPLAFMYVLDQSLVKKLHDTPNAVC